jgi:hypothetical protein
MKLIIVVGGLALAIALVTQWHVGQWQVPKAWARIFLGCRAVGIVYTSLCSSVESQFYFSFFKSQVG